MPRKIEAYLEEILESIDAIASFVKGIDFIGYTKDVKTKAAVERKLLNIGEALNQLASFNTDLETRVIDLRKIVAFRNILVHGYFGVDDSLVWDVISNKLEQLKTDLAGLAKLSLIEPHEIHPWRLCPEGQYWRRAHIQPTYRKADGTIVHRHPVKAGCCDNPSGKDQIYSEELEKIAGMYFSKLNGPPAADNLNFPNGSAFDDFIRGWTRFWNDVLKPTNPLDPDFVKALIATESGFRPNIKVKDSPRNGYARGLMQVTDFSLRILGDQNGELKDHFVHVDREDIMAPNLNIASGIRWLFDKERLASSKLCRTASWEETVADYKGLLKKLVKDPANPPKPIRDLRDYYRRLKGK